MSIFSVSIGDKEYQVRVHRDRLTVDGEPIDVSLIPLNGNGMQLLRRNRKALELHFSHQDAKNYQILVEGHLIQAQVRPGGRGGRARAQQKTEGALSAPMPGLVIDVHVSEGDKVTKGQLLAVVESMKMQMQMRSSLDGIAQRVAVKPGDQVVKGQMLIHVNPLSA